MSALDYDYIVIGSGFGGSVSALRLSEKGYKVLVIEKGKWKSPSDFPKTNWNLRKWLWLPALGWYGIFKMTFFRHLSVISGVGVGGGSLVYANTLPKPKTKFYETGSWQGLADWEKELKPYYQIAYRMLGAAENPKFFDADKVLQAVSTNQKFEATKVAVYFGDENQAVSDPYFNGAGPDRTGCNFCGQCMTGCPNNAKNTLDKNYLFLAQLNGTEILAEHFVTGIIPENDNTYTVQFRKTGKYFGRIKHLRTKGIIISGGVLGTIPLLLKLKRTTMPEISDMLGKDIRSNNEALIFVTTPDKKYDMSKGVAIGSILNISEYSHLEPVRYGKGSGFWRIGVLPLVTEKFWLKRLGKLLWEYLKSPVKWLKIYTVKDFAKQTTVLLYMQSLEGKLQLKNHWYGVNTNIQDGKSPSAFIPEAHELARKYARKINGKPMSFVLENLSGIPSTAHILGGAVIGKDKNSGVIDVNQQLFNYPGIYICDGSAISANPGVNPALTITAMTERVMAKIPAKNQGYK
jgi:cholesterol oxidase